MAICRKKKGKCREKRRLRFFDFVIFWIERREGGIAVAKGDRKEVYISAAGFQLLDNLTNDTVDLCLNTCGVQNCAPGHWFGPGTRDEYLIHFICEGKGVYRVNGEAHALGKGDYFVIFPDTDVYYEADRREPWEYIWVGFRGIKAASYLKCAGIDETRLIGRYSNSSYILSCVQQMMLARASGVSNELKRTAALFQILAVLIEDYAAAHPEEREDPRASRAYLDQALAYMDEHLSENIRINDIAAHIGIDRTYLTAVFQQALSLSPKEYLVHYRVNRACMLLRDPDRKISEIAKAVGYDDPLSFSKIFKKCKGVTPSEYRLHLA